MRNAFVAEWLVSRWTDKRRAASMVGDLVELQPHKGPLWFWLSIARILASLAWRGTVAWVALTYTWAWVYYGLEMAIFGIHAQRHPPDGFLWLYVFSSLMAVATLSWMTLIYSAICYGSHDKVTQLALVLACLVTGGMYFWWQPILLAVCSSLGIGALAASVAHRDYRKAGLVVVVTLATGIIGVWLMGFLSNQYQHFIYPGPLGDRELREHPSIQWVTLALMLMLAWSIAATCSRMHHWLMPSKQIDSGIEC